MTEDLKIIMRTYRRGSHCVFNIKAHLVLVTAYRRKAIDADILECLKKQFEDVCSVSGCCLIEFSGETDHVHLLLDLGVTVRPSDFVRRLKSVSSRYVRTHFRDRIRDKLWGNKFWSSGYCLISVGDCASIETVKKYIQNQEQPE